MTSWTITLMFSWVIGIDVMDATGNTRLIDGIWKKKRRKVVKWDTYQWNVFRDECTTRRMHLCTIAAHTILFKSVSIHTILLPIVFLRNSLKRSH